MIDSIHIIEDILLRVIDSCLCVANILCDKEAVNLSEPANKDRHLVYYVPGASQI